MIKETQISERLMFVERENVIELRFINPITGNSITAIVLDPIQAIHLRNNISIWANNKRNRDKKNAIAK